MGIEKSKLIKLGLLILAGFAVFLFAIFYIGSKESLFEKTFTTYSVFQTVNGLSEGNNVQFAGINVGTIQSIDILASNRVKVVMQIQERYKKFIKKDSEASINSEGLVGNKVLLISGGTPGSTPVDPGDSIKAVAPAQLGDIINNLNESTKEAQKIASEISEIAGKVNRGEGTLGKLVNNSDLFDNIDSLTGNFAASSESINRILNQTSNTVAIVNKDVESLSKSIEVVTKNLGEITGKINSSQSLVGTLLTDTSVANNIKNLIKNTRMTTANLEMASFGFYQNMEALKHNFLFKGYFEDRGYWDESKDEESSVTREARILQKEGELDMRESELRDAQNNLEELQRQLKQKIDSLKLIPETPGER